MPEFNPNHAQRMSNYQYCLLREADRTGGLSLDRVLAISQVFIGSVVRRGFLRWNAGVEKFQVTPEALTVMRLFNESNINRSGWDRPLSSAITKEKWGRGLDKATEHLRAQFHDIIRNEKRNEE